MKPITHTNTIRLSSLSGHQPDVGAGDPDLGVLGVPPEAQHVLALRKISRNIHQVLPEISISIIPPNSCHMSPRTPRWKGSRGKISLVNSLPVSSSLYRPHHGVVGSKL